MNSDKKNTVIIEINSQLSKEQIEKVIKRALSDIEVKLLVQDKEEIGENLILLVGLLSGRIKGTSVSLSVKTVEKNE